MCQQPHANGRDARRFLLQVEWHDCVWRPAIGFQPGWNSNRNTTIKPLPVTALLTHPNRLKNLVKPMKTRLPSRAAFTLIELLVVIAIIGILAAMLMPVLVKGKVATQKMKAKTEISQIVTAIEAYDTDYGRFPMTQAEQAAAGTNDFTTGYIQYPQANVTWPAGSGGSYAFGNNTNVVAILMDLQTFGNSVNTMNYNHVKNPKQVKYLSATMAADVTLPGVGPDGVYRDPWGNPYVITMNSSYNEEGTSDLFYSQKIVSQDPPNSSSSTGYYGLHNPNYAANQNNFLFHGKVMVWSAGPDKQVEAGPANTGKNKDNVLSWQ